MSVIMKIGYVLSPFLRLGNFLKRIISRSINHFNKLESSSTTFKLGSWNNEPLVQTKYGQTLGFSDKNSWSWKGIPYATPPVGSLRWKAPLDPSPWVGIHKAKKFGNSAAQYMFIMGPIGSEDCLYLNIWRPKTSETKLPVYFYIHGGGNSIGTSAEKAYYGNAVSEKSNLLYVSVNYRLGAMGWFLHPAVTGTGSAEDKSGNFATLDLVKALEWVRENIEAFGGDSNNVTIAGESAGAFNTLSLLISPTAKGLFHHAIVESALSLIWSTSAAETQSRDLLIRLLIKDHKAKNKEDALQVIDNKSEKEINEYFRSKSPFTIAKCIPKMDFGMADWRAIYTDGTVIPKDGYSVFSTGEWANKVPLIIGCNKDELKLFGYFRKYPLKNSREYDLIWKYRSLLWRVSGLDSLVSEMASQSTVNIYAYRFDWGSLNNDGESVLPRDLGRNLGAHHAAEIPFFLGMGIGDIAIIIGKTHNNRNRPGREKLRELCMKYLANFARTGDPNAKDLPNWPGWQNIEGKEKVLVLDANNDDLRLSYLTEIISVQDILDLIKSEVVEPELGKMLSELDEIIPFGVKEQGK